MSDPDNKTPKRISLTVWMRIESACSEFEDALKKGESPRVESYLKGREEIERRQLLLNLLLLEFDYTTEPLKKLEQNFIKRFPEDQGIVTLALNKHQEKYAEQQDSVHFSEATYPTHEEHSEESSKIPRHLRYIEDYKLISLLGTGGMGVVYRAQHRVTMEDFALKMLKTGEHSTEAQVDRFLLEAKAAAKLDHPHIVPIYETGYRNGVPYFVMDYIDGNNLEEIRQQKQMSQMEAVQVVKQAAEAIQFAHDADIIHRDIKPSNLLIDNTGHVWVTDFGLARILSEDNDRLTQSNQLLGTPGFMPPEQALGQRAAIGKRSDVYSLGAVLYFLLTGRPPFQGETLLETVNLVVDSDPAPPRSLDPQIQPGLELVCLKCLQKHPQDRYSGATALASELDRWQSGRPLFVELGDSSEEVHEASFSTVALSAILLTVFSMILIIFMIRGGEEPTRPVRPQFSQNQEEPDDSTVSNRFQWKYREGQQTPGATEEPKVPDSLIRNAGKPGLTVPPPGPPPPDGPEPPEEIAILPLEAPGVHGQIELPIAPPTGSYPWSVVPSHARAVAVVPNIERFSDRMDTFAREMGVSAPRILAEAKKYSKLHQGLREDGALIWTWGEKKEYQQLLRLLYPLDRS